MKIKKDDKIMVMAGKDRGETGTVTRILPDTNQVVVQNLNVAKRHTKPSNRNPRGGILEISRPMPAGKVQLVCPVCKKPTRVGYQIKGDNKERICRKCQAVIK